MREKTLLILSGGMDSSTLLYHLLDMGHKVEALSFDYLQRHRRELDSAKRICELTNVPHEILQIPALTGSALTFDKDVPHGHYEEESMKDTVVPNRNMVMLAHAASTAIARGHDNVAYGCHHGDHAIYPDCRAEFVAAMSQAFALCDWKEIKLLTPFLTWDKGAIARRGAELEVPFELTWTCYEGGEEPCGKCGACVERAEAMATINAA